MPLLIDDETLDALGLTEREARIEIACRLYDAEKIALWPAAKLAGFGTRSEMEAELLDRGLAVFRYTEEDWEQDRKHIEKAMGIRLPDLPSAPAGE